MGCPFSSDTQSCDALYSHDPPRGIEERSGHRQRRTKTQANGAQIEGGFMIETKANPTAPIETPQTP